MLRRIAVVLLLASLPACSNVVDPSKNVIEPKTGPIPKGGSGRVETFNSKNGEVTIIVTSLTPAVPSGTIFGVVYGQFISGQCVANSQNQFAVVGGNAISGSIFSGSYCVYVIDEGFFPTDETYTMTISHP